MSKWYGKIGYNITSETEPGIWESSIIEKNYFGDLTTDHRKRQQGDRINSNINLTNVISIISDPFIIQNCSYIAYVEIMGSKWLVNDIEIAYPRLNLSIGGVYNENTTTASE